MKQCKGCKTYKKGDNCIACFRKEQKELQELLQVTEIQRIDGLKAKSRLRILMAKRQKRLIETKTQLSQAQKAIKYAREELERKQKLYEVLVEVKESDKKYHLYELNLLYTMACKGPLFKKVKHIKEFIENNYVMSDDKEVQRGKV